MGKAIFRLAAIFIALSSSAMAQTRVKPKPIPQKTIETAITIVSINNCFLLSKKIDYKTVLESATGAVGGLVFQEHGAMIEGVNNNKPLTQEQLGNSVAFQIAAQTAARCESFIPEEDKKKIKEVIERTFKSLPNKKP